MSVEYFARNWQRGLGLDSFAASLASRGVVVVQSHRDGIIFGQWPGGAPGNSWMCDFEIRFEPNFLLSIHSGTRMQRQILVDEIQRVLLEAGIAVTLEEV